MPCHAAPPTPPAGPAARADTVPMTARPTLPERCETLMIHLAEHAHGFAVLSRPADVELRREVIDARGWLGEWWEFEPLPDVDVEALAGRVDENVTLRVPFAWPLRLACGRRNRPPEAADVLRALLSDAAAWLNAPSYEGWAAEAGFDPDEDACDGCDGVVENGFPPCHTGHRQVFDKVGELTGQVEAFLGEAFDDFLWETAG